MPTSHWSLEDLAYRLLKDAHYRDMSRSTVQRILAEADLKPHKSRYWLHSDDPDFEAKAVAICRLYLDAPRLYQQGELVVCVDEKTGIQALERLHPTKPARPGRVELQEFEYLRHGTAPPAGELVVPTGQVVGSVTARRATWDFVRHVRDVVVGFPHAKHPLGDGQPEHALDVQAVPLPGEEVGGLAGPAEAADGGATAGLPARPVAQARGTLHAEAWELAESDRNLVRRAGAAVAAPRGVPLGGGAGGADPGVHRTLRPPYAHPYAWTYTGKPLASGDTRKRKKRIRYRRKQLVDIGSR